MPIVNDGKNIDLLGYQSRTYCILKIYTVNICVSGEIHSTFLEILLWSATEQVTGN